MVRRAAAGQSKSKQSHLNNRKCVGVFLLVFCLVFLHEAIQNYISKSKSRVHVFITHPIDPAPKEKTRAPSIHAHTLSMAICELLQTSLGLDTHKILLHFSFPRMIVPWNQQLLHRWAPEKKRQTTEKTPACRQLQICGTHHYDPHKGQQQLWATCGSLREHNYAEAKYFLRTGSSWCLPHPQEQTPKSLMRFE